jgi:hypothetical protein
MTTVARRTANMITANLARLPNHALG